MRTLVTLPLAAIAFAAAPAFAQDITPPDDMGRETTMPAPQQPSTAVPPMPETTIPAPEADPLPADPAPTPDADPMAQPIPPAATDAPASDPQEAAPEDAIDAMDDAVPPSDVTAYRNALPPERQALFDRIAEADQAKLAAMAPAQQEKAWASLEEQAAAQAAAEPEADTSGD